MAARSRHAGHLTEIDPVESFLFAIDFMNAARLAVLEGCANSRCSLAVVSTRPSATA